MVLARYNIDNLKRALRNPSYFVEEMNRLVNGSVNKIVQQTFMRPLFRYRYGSGTKVMDEDWDNLIILDACRSSDFEKCSNINGKLKSKVSLGSTSREWISKNFDGGEFHDTVYVGGNPHMEKLTDEFHHVKKSYSESSDNDFGGEDSIPGWHPEAVQDSALDTISEFPNKRLIIHFMQPHDPYLGSKAKKLRNDISQEHNLGFRKFNHMKNGEAKYDQNLGDLRYAAKEGYISRSQLLEVYRENLSLILDYVNELIGDLDGKTVISADHGELLGESHFSKSYGHPIGVYCSELRIVPWLEVESGNRREIYSEEPIGAEEAKEKKIKENLEALGYK